MRRIVAMLSVSPDGFFEGPAGELDWHLVDEEVHAHFNEVLGGMGARCSTAG
jgi:dihydrofolate reductase